MLNPIPDLEALSAHARGPGDHCNTERAAVGFRRMALLPEAPNQDIRNEEEEEEDSGDGGQGEEDGLEEE